jgi:hypothetical protein
VTFSLEPTVWQEEDFPEAGNVVLLSKIRRKRAGWRAKAGRYYVPSDEHQQPARRNEMTKELRACATITDCVGQSVRRLYHFDGEYVHDAAGHQYKPDCLTLDGKPLYQDFRVISPDDPAAIRTEVEEYGHKHLFNLLSDWGFITVEKAEKFAEDVSRWPGGTIGYQFDTGGISSGVERDHILRVGGLEHRFTTRMSR